MAETDDKMCAYNILTMKPVFSLAECLAAGRGLPWLDGDACGGDIIKDIAEWFRTCVYLCGTEELGFLSHAAGRVEEIIALDEITRSQPFDIFHRNQVIYLFLHCGRYRIVLPRELAEVYREVTESDGFAVTNARFRELSDYTAALLNIYGTCETWRFVAIWNHHHKDKITEEEAVGFLRDRANFHFDFYFLRDCIVHDSLEEDDFEVLREATRSLHVCYMPTKSVIREYSVNGYASPVIPGQREMDRFLAEYITDGKDLENVCADIRAYCERAMSPEHIAELLNTVNAPLGDDIFREGFELRYNRLSNAAHIWPLNGLTFFGYQNETGTKFQRFALPENKKRGKGKTRRR